MNVTVELLGYQKTAAGVDSVEFPLSNSATALDALNYVIALYPKTYLEPDRVIFNVNNERVPADSLLKAGDTVRFLPILGGG